MDKCRNCGCESLMWTEKRDFYYCPKCEKSFSVDEKKDEVKFSGDLVDSIASQVVGQITPLIEKALDKKIEPVAKNPPHDGTGSDEVSDGPVPKKDERHKWDP